MRSRHKVHEQCFPHFVTCTFRHWIPVLSRDDYFRLVAESLTFCCEHKGLLVHGYVLMPNHLHAIVTQPQGRLSDILRDFKAFTSREIAGRLEQDGRLVWLRAFRNAGPAGGSPKVWDDGFYPEQVHSEEFFLQKMLYMLDNPVRAGYVENAVEWRYSSAGFWLLEKPSAVPLTGLEW